MATEKELKKKLRSLARSLRPFEREAGRIAQELSKELICFDDDSELKPTPEEVKRYCEIDDIQFLTDDIAEMLQRIREDIASLLRPKPRTKEETRRKAARTPDEGT